MTNLVELPARFVTEAQLAKAEELQLSLSTAHRYNNQGELYIYEFDDYEVTLHVIDEDGKHHTETRGLDYEGWDGMGTDGEWDDDNENDEE